MMCSDGRSTLPAIEPINMTAYQTEEQRKGEGTKSNRVGVQRTLIDQTSSVNIALGMARIPVTVS
jgi:hypothetical protein